MGGLSNMLEGIDPSMLALYGAQLGSTLWPKTAGINKLTQQQIGTMNKQKQMASFYQQLSDAIGGGGKMTIDSKGMKMDIPHGSFGGQPQDAGRSAYLRETLGGGPAPEDAAAGSASASAGGAGGGMNPMAMQMMLSQFMGGGQGQGQGQQGQNPVNYGGGAAVQPANPNAQLPSQRTNLMDAILNPSSSSLDASGANLAGLTPQDLSTALNDAINFETTRRGAYTAASDVQYKQAYIDEMAQRREAALIDRGAFPVPVPGVGTVSFKQWDALPNDTKTYAAYVYQQRQMNPNEPIMSPAEWQMVDKDTKIGFLKELDKNKRLEELQIRLNRASSTNINLSPYERTKQTELAKAEADVEAPAYVDSVVEDLKKRDPMAWMDPSNVSKYVSKGMSEDAAIDMSRKEMVLKEIDARLRQAYKGKSVTRKVDGWYVDGKLVRRNPYK